MTWPEVQKLLAEYGHPSEVILHYDDYRRLRHIVAGPSHQDERGPFVWAGITKIRPAPGEDKVVDLSATPIFADGPCMGWR